MAFLNVQPYKESTTNLVDGLQYTFQGNTYQIVLHYNDESVYSEKETIIYLRNLGVAPPNDMIRVVISNCTYEYYEITHVGNDNEAFLDRETGDRSRQIGINWSYNEDCVKVTHQSPIDPTPLQVGDPVGGGYTAAIIEPDLVVLHSYNKVLLCRHDQMDKLPSNVHIAWRD